MLYAEGDADLLIVQTAVTMSNTCPVVLVGDDMDLFVLLLYQSWVELNDIFFCPEPKKGTLMKSLSVKAARLSLGKNVCDKILFVQDTIISRLFGIGKATGLKLTTDKELL